MEDDLTVMNSVMFGGVENPLQRSEVTDQLKSSHTDKWHYIIGLKGTGVFMNHFITHIHRLSRSITSLLADGDTCEMCVVSVAACVGINTDEVMTLTHYSANTYIEHSSFGPADGWTSHLLRLLRFKHGCG